MAGKTAFRDSYLSEATQSMLPLLIRGATLISIPVFPEVNLLYKNF